MPQFPMTEDRRWALEKVPDYSVIATPLAGRARVICQGVLLADSTRALQVAESKHAAVIYFPRDDVQLDRLVATAHSTYCPFKGHASYWSFPEAGAAGENLVWSYEEPFPEVADLCGAMAFYSNRASIEVVGAG